MVIDVWPCPNFRFYLYLPIRMISGITFTRHSSSIYINRKLNRLSIIYNNLLDCIDIINVSFTKYIFLIMIAAAVMAILCLFGQFQWGRLMFQMCEYRLIIVLNIYRTLIRYEKTADKLSKIFAVFLIDFLFLALIPSIWLSSNAMNKVTPINFPLVFMLMITNCKYVKIGRENVTCSHTHRP